MRAVAKPYLLLAFLALIWGAHWPLAKIALRDLPPFTYGAMRAAIGLLAIAGVQAIRGQLHVPDRRDWPIIVSVGIGQMAGGIVLMNLALSQIAAGRSSILVYTMPLWVLAIQIAATRHLASGRQLVGLIVGLVGIALLINPFAIDWNSPGEDVGSAELILSAIIWAVTTIHIRSHEWHSTPMELEAWQLLVAVVPLVVAAAIIDGGKPVDLNPVSVSLALYSGLLATAVGFWLSQSISRSLSPLSTTMGFLSVPLVGLLSAAALLGESLELIDFVGFAATFVGILVVSLSPGTQADPGALDPEAALASSGRGNVR